MRRAEETATGDTAAGEDLLAPESAGDIPLVILPDAIALDDVLTDQRFSLVDDEELALAVVAEEIDDELEEELAVGEGGLFRIFAMPRVCAAAACLTFALLAVLFVVGRSYYLLPVSQRPLHYFHQALRPSGSIGLSLGVAGTVLTLASLGYLVKKNVVSVTRRGSLRAWLGFHIFAGLVGPALILFHAALVPYSAVGALAFFGMVVVVLSGILGRYVYVYFPRSLEGRELEFTDVRRRLAVYRKKLIQMGVDPALLRVDAASQKDRSPWLIEALVRVIYGDRQSRGEYRRLRDAIRARGKLGQHAERVLLMARRLCRERQWLVRYREFRKLMGAWRFLHRWLAIVTLAAVGYHVAIGIGYGALWIFGGGR